MKYWYQKPHQLISDYVRSVLILEGFSKEDETRLPFFAGGMPALLCRTEKDQQGNNEAVKQLTLYGKSAPSECWSTNGTTTIIAYFFKPFALATAFNIPASALMKSSIDLCNWNAHKINALRTQLMYAESTSHKVQVLDNLIIQQLQQNFRECAIIKSATDQIMCNSGTEILSEILKELNLNARTFQRIFKKYVGITPSQYRRICQFQLSFTQLRAKKFNTLTDIAYDNGFADQSHFIRSFREFTQITPNHYLRSGLKGKDQ